MAQAIFQHIDNTIEEELPKVCMCCGAPSAWTAFKRFTWRPPEARFLSLLGPFGWLVKWRIPRYRVHMRAPLCDAHVKHWQWRARVWWGGLAVLIVGLFCAIVMEDMTSKRGLGTLWFISLVMWGLAGTLLQRTSIRATLVTDSDIALTNISPLFAEALAGQRKERLRSGV